MEKSVIDNGYAVFRSVDWSPVYSNEVKDGEIRH